MSSKSATLSDSPTAPWARKGKAKSSSEFETVAIVLETREPLGALKWGYKIKDAADAPIELTGAQAADCVDAPSAEWWQGDGEVLRGQVDTILDDFDSAKADLKPDHKTKLDGIVTRMKANVALKAQELGGASDLKETTRNLSLKRAEAARDYLVGKGIAAARIRARVKATAPVGPESKRQREACEGKNRRVQVWLR